MVNVWKSDLYRLGKSKLLYGVTALTGTIAFLLAILMRQDIRVGISVFGNLTAFKGIDDIIRMGIAYPKGLGVFVAIVISIFIGQEYQWQTWQQKWITSQSRIFLYLSKAAVSSVVSVFIFLVYQIVVLLGSGEIQEQATAEYAGMMISGASIYAALGTVICLVSMLVKSSTASLIFCFGYVLLSETWVSVLKNLSGLSGIAAKIIEWGNQHSLYGMSTAVSGPSFSSELTVSISMNSFATMLLSTATGLLLFRRYEL